MKQPIPSQRSLEPWWRIVSVPENRTASIQLGTLQVSIERARREWNITRHRSRAGEEDATFVYHEVPPDEPPDGAERQRFPCRETSPQLHLKPALADLPLVVRPEVGLFLPSG